MPCPALPCPALKPRFPLKRHFIQPHFYLPSTIGAVLSLTLFFTHSAHAQSNWWEQQTRTPPAPVEPISPSPPTHSFAEPPSQTISLEQEDNLVTKPVRENKDQSTNNDTLVFNYGAIEYGVTEFTVLDIDEKARGGYFRALIGPSSLYFQGTYQKQAKNFTITEFGIGSISPHQPIQLTSSLTTQRWKLDDYQRSFTKAMIGLRTEFSPHFNMWIGTGRLWTRKNNFVYNHKGQIIETDLVSTLVGNIGLQILLEPISKLEIKINSYKI